MEEGAVLLAQLKFSRKLALKLIVLDNLEQSEQNSTPKNLRFDLEKFSDRDARFYFRFSKSEIYRLIRGLKLPDVIITSDRSSFQSVEATCVLLRRLVYPNRLGDLREMFYRSKSQLSRIINWMFKFVNDHFGYLLESMDLFWLDRSFLEDYASKIQARGAPLDNCVGFVDGTLRPLCRPGINQRELYNGHKRVHGLKFQSVVVPNGLITNLYGPIQGRRHDSFMLGESKLLEELEQKFGIDFCIYGDPAYPIRAQLLAPYRKSVLTIHEQQFNKSMSVVRECVEWQFGKVASLFAFVDFKKNLKLDLQPVALYYKVDCIFSNCHSCLRGSQTGFFFGITPPSLEEYFSNQIDD